MYRPQDTAEIVVRQHDVAGLFGYIRPLHAHGNANIRLFEGRRIVGPIARNGHHLSGFLQEADQPRLAFHGSGTGNNAKFGEDPLDLVVRLLGKFIARHLDVAWLEHADPLSNGMGRQRMVARDHLNFDPCNSTVLDGLWHVFAHRIGHANDGQQCQAVLAVPSGVFSLWSFVPAMDFAANGQRTNGLGRHRFDGPLNVRPTARQWLESLFIHIKILAKRQNLFRSALGKYHAAPVFLGIYR